MLFGKTRRRYALSLIIGEPLECVSRGNQVTSHDPIPDVVYTSQSVNSSLITMRQVLNDELEPLEGQPG